MNNEQPNFQLIMLDTPIIVSDGKPHEKMCYDFTQHQIIKCGNTNIVNKYHKEGKLNPIISGHSNLPPFQFAEGVDEEIGIVDVQLIAEERHPIGIFHEHDINEWDRNNFIEGFEAAQQLNKNKFSEEDVIEFAEWRDGYLKGLNKWRVDGEYAGNKFTTKELLHLWQQSRPTKIYDVELEMENGQLKITNNSFKITKIIKK